MFYLCSINSATKSDIATICRLLFYNTDIKLKSRNGDGLDVCKATNSTNTQLH